MQNAGALGTIALLVGGSLLVAALGVGSVLAAWELLAPSDFWAFGGAFSGGFVATVLLGAVPALALGVPAYWFLWRTHRARWPVALGLGGVLGALIALAEPGLALWGVGCGTVCAGLTHLGAARWLGPNSSSRPTPLAAAA